MCMYMYNCIYSQSISCRRLLSLFSLSNCINAFVWHNNCIRKHEYEFITTITIEFGEFIQYKLILKQILNAWKSVFPLNADLLRTQLFIVKKFRNAIKSKVFLVKKSYFHNPINILLRFPAVLFNQIYVLNREKKCCRLRLFFSEKT